MTNLLENQAEFKSFLRKPYDRKKWINTFTEIFSNIEIGANPPKLTTGWEESFKSCTWIGKINLKDDKDRSKYVWIIEVALDEQSRIKAKVALRKGLSKILNAGSVEAVIAFFSSNDGFSEYRVTFASAEWDFYEGKLLKKETPTKRFSFVLGPSESCTTASQRLLSLAQKKQLQKFDDLVEAFSVEKLNRDFFDGYINQYKQILNSVSEVNAKKFFNLNYPEGIDNLLVEPEFKQIRAFVKRFMGRVVFLYFVQKKGWLGADKNANESIYINGNPIFIKELFSKFKSENGYEAFQYLFFELLNKDRESLNDICSLTDSKVPYLNSGLFEPEVISEEKKISAYEQHKKIVIPNSSVNKYLEFLDQFNFTVDENSPLEGDIGIDPEMLGHIFENLLEDNKNKGTYYTPKLVVEFMVKETLITLFLKKLKITEEEKDQVVSFVRGRHSVRQRPNKKTSSQIINLLSHLKVCDPAVGSGAFPIGILNEVVWMMIDLGDDRPIDQIKKSVILNSIRGVDFDSNAIEIARLRFWLTLIVDAVQPEPLPNLDFTLLQGNSLLGVGSAFKAENFLKDINHQQNSQISLSLTTDTNLDGDLENLLINFYSSHGSEKIDLLSKIQLLEKSAIDKLKTEYQDLLKNLKRKNKSLNQKDSAKIIEFEASLERLNASVSEKNYFLWHWYFGDIAKEGGFDIVIGNPPYVSALEFTRTRPVTERDEIKHLYHSATGAWDLFVPFFELGINLLKDDGVLGFITPNKYLSASYAIDLRKVISTRCSLKQIVDLSQLDVFKNVSVYPIISILQKSPSDTDPVLCRTPKNINRNRYTPYDFQVHEIQNKNLYILPDMIWGFLLSNKLDLLLKLLKKTQPMILCADVNATTTAGEADEYGAKISEYRSGMFKVINTGTIDPFISKWGSSYLTHQGNKWLNPGLSIKAVSEKRASLYKTPKILFAKMAATAEAYLDINGDYAALNVNCIYRPKDQYSLEFLLGYCNSSFFMFFYDQFFSALRMGKGYQFQSPQLRTIPVPKNMHKDFREEIERIVENYIAGKGNCSLETIRSSLDLKFADFFECKLDELK